MIEVTEVKDSQDDVNLLGPVRIKYTWMCLFFSLFPFANQKHTDVSLIKWTNSDEEGAEVEIQELEG